MGQSGVEPQALFEIGDIVRWKRQELNGDRVNFLINMTKKGFVECFKVKKIINTVESENCARGHKQLLLISVCNNPEKTIEISGWWFEKFRREAV